MLKEKEAKYSLSDKFLRLYTEHNQTVKVKDKSQEQQPQQEKEQCLFTLTNHISPQLVPPPINLDFYDTPHIQTIFKIQNNLPCFFPKYKLKDYTILSPLAHKERKLYTHVWLNKLGTHKYLDILEDVRICATRLEAFGEGEIPLISSLSTLDSPNFLGFAEEERSKNKCPLVHFRNLGNGYFVVVNVNDLERSPLDLNPLLI